MRIFPRAAALVALALACLPQGRAHAATMQCAPYQQLGAAPYPTGGPYTADAAGIVTGVSPNDINAMDKAGCQMVGVAGNTLIGRLLGANMNLAGSGAAAQDQPLNLWVNPAQYYRLTKVTAKNCSGSVTTAVGGIYTASAQGGTAVVAATQVYSANTGPTLSLDLTIATTPGKTAYLAGSTPLYLNLSTAQGAAMTCDFFIYADIGQ